MKFAAIQKALQEADLDGWLFYDFQNRDPVAYRVLGLPDKHTSRRWFFYVPARGEPRGLVHAVEPTKLDPLPGRKATYLSWQQLRQMLRELLGNAKRVAMQYSPQNAIPYVSLVDAGTIELVRACGVEVVSSADLVQSFEALVSPEAFRTHELAGQRMHAVLQQTWQEVRARLNAGASPTEFDIQQYMLELFARNHLTADDQAPIVAVNGHAADPHFDPHADVAVPIREGDCLLIDLWARLDQPGAIYYDITWCGYVGEGRVPERYAHIFKAACHARDRAVEYLQHSLAVGEPVHGWQVDKVCRGDIEAAGFGAAFVHRTGHSIGTAVHGNGVNIDNLETQDQRRIVPRVLFSIEPGIYLPEEGLGVRTEIDVFVSDAHEVVICGPVQQELVRV